MHEASNQILQHQLLSSGYSQRLAGQQKLMNVHRWFTNIQHTDSSQCSHAQHCSSYYATEMWSIIIRLTSCSMAVELVSLPPSVRAITTAGSR